MRRAKKRRARAQNAQQRHREARLPRARQAAPIDASRDALGIENSWFSVRPNPSSLNCHSTPIQHPFRKEVKTIGRTMGKTEPVLRNPSSIALRRVDSTAEGGPRPSLRVVPSSTLWPVGQSALSPRLGPRRTHLPGRIQGAVAAGGSQRARATGLLSKNVNSCCTTGPFISGTEHRTALCRASSSVPSTLYGL
jgi:hypothetical protein